MRSICCLSSRGQHCRKQKLRKSIMEAAVDKVEALFQKSEADLDYIEKRLKLDFINKTSESGVPEENPVVLLKKLTEIKAHHAALSSQVQELAADQRRTVDSIRANLDQAQKALKELQDKAELTEPPDALPPGPSS